MHKLMHKGLKYLLLLLLVPTIICAKPHAVRLPSPGKTLVLTLQDAVMLSLRTNPDVISGELDRISQKYALLVAKNDFAPQYSLTGDAYYQKEDDLGILDSTTGDLNASVSLKTPYGTTFTLSSYNSLSGENNYSPALSLEVVQPLIQGFGKAVVMSALYDAIDTEESNKLQLKQTVINTVTTIINDYMQVIEAKDQLKVAQQSLSDYERTYHTNEKLIAAGKIARTDNVATKAQIASQKAAIQNDKNTIRQNTLTLLKDLGLDPEANVRIPDRVDFPGLIAKLKAEHSITGLPSMQQCKLMALSSDTGYITTGIGLKSLSRSLLTAKDQNRWQLDLNASESIGGNFTTTRDITAGGLETNFTNNRYVGLQLNIPINNMANKQQVIDARIALEKAHIQYQQQKREIERAAEDSYNTVISTKEQLKLTEESLTLQAENLHIARRKYSAGRISNFELIKDQQDFSSAQVDVINDQIALINALVQLNKTIGTTLDNWGIKVKY